MCVCGGGGGGGRLELVCGRPTLAALGSALVHQTKQLQPIKTKRIKHKQKAKRAADIEGQMVTMLKSHTRHINTQDTTAIKPARKNHEKRTTSRSQNRSAAFGRPMVNSLGGGGGGAKLVCGRPTLALSSALVPQIHSCSVCVEDSYLINA